MVTRKALSRTTATQTNATPGSVQDENNARAASAVSSTPRKVLHLKRKSKAEGSDSALNQAIPIFKPHDHELPPLAQTVQTSQTAQALQSAQIIQPAQTTQADQSPAGNTQTVNAQTENAQIDSQAQISDNSVPSSNSLAQGANLANLLEKQVDTPKDTHAGWNFPDNALGWRLHQQLQAWLEQPTKVNLNHVPDWLTKVWALANAPYCQPEVSFSLLLALVGNSKLLKQIDLVIAQWNTEHEIAAKLWAGFQEAKSFIQKPQLPKSVSRRRYIELGHEMDLAQESWQQAFDWGFYPACLLLQRLKGYREELEGRLSQSLLDVSEKEEPKISAATIAMFGQPTELQGDESLDEALDKISHPLSLGYHQGYAGAINALTLTLLDRYASRQQGLYLNVLDQFLGTQPAVIKLPAHIKKLLSSVEDAYTAHHAACARLHGSLDKKLSASTQAITASSSGAAPQTTARAASDRASQVNAKANDRDNTNANASANTSTNPSAQVTAAAYANAQALEFVPWYHLPWLYTLSQRLTKSQELAMEQDLRDSLRQCCLQTLISPALGLLPDLQTSNRKTAATQSNSGAMSGINSWIGSKTLPNPARIAGQVIDLSPWLNESTSLALVNSMAALYDLAEMEIKQLPSAQESKTNALIKQAQTHLECFLLLQSSILGTMAQRAIAWNAYQELVSTYKLNVKEFLRKLDHNPAASFMLCWLYLSGIASRTDYGAAWAYLNQTYALIAHAQPEITKSPAPAAKTLESESAGASKVAKTLTSLAQAARSKLDVPRGMSFLDSIVHSTKKLQEQNNAYMQLLTNFTHPQTTLESNTEDGAAQLTFLGTNDFGNVKDELSALYSLEYLDQEAAEDEADENEEETSSALEQTTSRVLAESLAQAASSAQDFTFSLDLDLGSQDAASAQSSAPQNAKAALEQASAQATAQLFGSSQDFTKLEGPVSTPAKRVLSLRKKPKADQANQDNLAAQPDQANQAKADAPERIKVAGTVYDGSDDTSAKLAALSDAIEDAESGHGAESCQDLAQTPNAFENGTADDAGTTNTNSANNADNTNNATNTEAAEASATADTSVEKYETSASADQSVASENGASSESQAPGSADTVQDKAKTTQASAAGKATTTGYKSTKKAASADKSGNTENAQNSSGTEIKAEPIHLKNTLELTYLQTSLSALPKQLQLNGLTIEREQLVVIGLANQLAAELSKASAESSESSARASTKSTKAKPTKAKDKSPAQDKILIEEKTSTKSKSIIATAKKSTKDKVQEKDQAQNAAGQPISALVVEGFGYTYLLPQIYALQAGLLLRGFGIGQNQRLALSAAEQWGECISVADVPQALNILKATSSLWSYLDTPDETFIHYVNRLAHNGDVAARLVFGLGLAYGIMGRNADMKQGKYWTDIAEKQGAAPQVFNKKLYTLLQQRIKG